MNGKSPFSFIIIIQGVKWDKISILCSPRITAYARCDGCEHTEGLGDDDERMGEVLWEHWQRQTTERNQSRV